MANPFPPDSTPCALVIFGATGDLTSRKLIPALYTLFKQQRLPKHFVCIGWARRAISTQQFRQHLRHAITSLPAPSPLQESSWSTFASQIFYHQANFSDCSGYQQLVQLLQQLKQPFSSPSNHLFYLSTPLNWIVPIIQQLHKCGLLPAPQKNQPYSRLIIEKPFGHDLDSARSLQKQIIELVHEQQIYRMDHYLGKETVQNLLPLRLTNPIFTPIWNSQFIDHVQISAAESLGVGKRGRFFEQTGLLRDMVQNHLLQLLALIAMEPPQTLAAEEIRRHKIALLHAITPFRAADLPLTTVRGQYGAGQVDAQQVRGYREEQQVDERSNVETYTALKLSIDTPRWQGTPFYLRAGKRLAKQATEIALFFKTSSPYPANVLRLRLQPHPSIELACNCKPPAQTTLQSTALRLRYQEAFTPPFPEAYERLLVDAIAGDQTLFVSNEEVLLSWQLLTPILHFWQAQPTTPFPNYQAGSWGPKEADQLLARDGQQWDTLQ